MNIKDVSFERERPDVCGDAHPKALLKAIQLWSTEPSIGHHASML